MRQALQYQRLAGRLIALHEEDPSLSGDGVMHEGEVSALLGLAGIPSISESTMVARDCALAALRGRPHPRAARVRARVGRGDRAREGRRACRSPARPRRTTCCSPTRRSASLDAQLQDEPAAALGGRPPGADRGAALGRRSTASPPTTPRTRARRRSSRSSWRRWASPASRPRSPRCTRPRAAGRADLELLVERMTARRRAVRPAGAVARAGSPRERLPGRPRRRVGGGRGRLREPLVQLRLRRPAPHRPGADDDRRRHRAPTASATFAIGARRREPPGLPAARGRHALRRRVASARRIAATGEVVFNTADVRLPGVGHRPELPRPDHRLHLPADRQLRRGRRGAWSRTASTRARSSCARASTARTPPAPRAAGSPGCATAASRRSPASTRARSCATSATRARCAAACSPAELAEAEARELVMAEPPMAGRDLAREVTPAEPVILDPDNPGPRDRRHRHRDQGARSCATCASAACGSSCTRARPPPRSCSRASPTRCSSPTAPATPPRSTTSSRPCAAWSARCRCSASAWATSCSAGRSASRPSSSRSATAAPTTRSRTSRPARSTSPARTTASRCSGPAASARSRPTSRCAGRPTSAPPSCRT